MTDTPPGFETAFHALTGFQPFPWQRRLFDRLVAGDWPDALDIPTGLGKTSVMPIWLLALASGSASPGGVPRRLVYVVNRRTIVDQATEAAAQLYDRLSDPSLRTCRERLARLAGQPNPSEASEKDCLAISTLRGRLADNRAWMRDAARPAIIVGTVDMIGSRLLFGAYRSSWKQRAMQAGLIGRDALIVHDESHLTQPFQWLLEWVRKIQEHDGFSGRRLRVLAMSATSVEEGRNDRPTNVPTHAPAVFTLNDADRAEPMVRQRLHAAKRLRLHPTERRSQIKRLAELAAAHEGGARRVIIYVRSPDDADKVVNELTGKSHGVDAERVALLTGTIRGLERDRLAEGKVIRALAGRDEPIDQTHYLVSTSAGEVGADFDADHLVCDAAALDSLVQRLGRVNRRGEAEQAARIDVVHDAKPPVRPSPVEAAAMKTLALLESVAEDDDGGRDVSPAALRHFVDGLSPDDRHAASSPTPAWSAPHEAVLDAWSLTSVRDPWPLAHGIAPYLHGLEDDQPPETTVAWREELNETRVPADPSRADLEALEPLFKRLYASHRLQTHETLTQRGRPPKKLVQLIARARDAVLEKLTGDERTQPVVVIRRGDKWAAHAVTAWADDRAIADAVTGATVILPVGFGGLSGKGMLNPDAKDAPQAGLDVADDQEYQKEAPRRRFLLERDEDGGWSVSALGPKQELAAGLADESAARDRGIEWIEQDQRRMRVTQRLALRTDASGDADRVLLVAGPREAPSKQKNAVLLADHVSDVVERVDRAAGGLGFHEAWQAVCRVAAELHDEGKKQPVWQNAVSNPNPDEPWGKSGRKGMNGKILNGYRHDLRSMIDALNDPRFTSLDEAGRDLVLHLIATHHGFGRPHFTPEAIEHRANGLGPLDDRLSPAAIAQRFDRLQRRFGHWGLAWLEAVFMSADIAASADTDADEQEDG